MDNVHPPIAGHSPILKPMFLRHPHRTLHTPLRTWALLVWLWLVWVLWHPTVAAAWPVEPDGLWVDDPATLQQLDQRLGFDLGQLALGARSPTRQAQALMALPSYSHMVTVLRNDLTQMRQQDPRLTVGMGGSRRLFDARWLSAQTTRFELVGVVNRMDRAPLLPKEAGCGEWRFIYRLAYQAPALYSRLPMTVNVVMTPEADTPDCTAVAQRWQAFMQTVRSAQQVPLAWRPADFGPWRLRSVEVNLQAVRWPSTVRPDMGGHAEYLLRVWRPQVQPNLPTANLVPAPLENTPDVARLTTDPALRQALKHWVNQPEVQAQLDLGVVQLPERFLATKAISVALNGPHRLANAPFTQLLQESEIQVAQPEAMRTLPTAHGVLRRLNDLTCMGCHQGRAVAGFHFLGRDPVGTAAGNAIRMPASVHFLTDQPRRLAHWVSVLNQTPAPLNRPLSVRADGDTGRLGDHCGLGDAAFAAWTCGAGLRCEPVVHDARVSRTGICMPQPTAPILAGTACRVGRMTHHANPHLDKVEAVAPRACGPQQVCEEVAVGFPNGMCSGACQGLQAGEACGSIAILNGFNACLASGKQPFDQCLSTHVRPGSLQACSTRTPCRDDYICTGNPPGNGVCIPPYFLFQLRVDGHPTLH